MPKFQVYWLNREVGILTAEPIRDQVYLRRTIPTFDELGHDAGGAIDERYFKLKEVSWSITKEEAMEFRSSELADHIAKHVPYGAEKFLHPTMEATKYVWLALQLSLEEYDAYEWLFDHEQFEPKDTPPDFDAPEMPAGRRVITLKDGTTATSNDGGLSWTTTSLSPTLAKYSETEAIEKKMVETASKAEREKMIERATDFMERETYKIISTGSPTITSAPSTLNEKMLHEAYRSATGRK